MRNQYLLLRWHLFKKSFLSGKITFRKVWNIIECGVSYMMRIPVSGKFPFIVSLETGNECNANCLCCRDENGMIHDANPAAKDKGGIPKGFMPVNMAVDIIDQVKQDALIAVLYTNGEPLLCKGLKDIIRACSERKLLSMIATNGILLDEERIETLLDSGIDFIKLQLSGFTQSTYSIQVRNGDVEKIKSNIRILSKKKHQKRSDTILMLDYISYRYNQHELRQARDFCKELGIMFNKRPGNPKGGLEHTEFLPCAQDLPLKGPCDWPWKGMQVNFNGDVHMCCDSLTFSGSEPYGKFKTGQSSVSDLWNGPGNRQVRKTLAKHGRKAIPVCSQCFRKGVIFKW